MLDLPTPESPNNTTLASMREEAALCVEGEALEKGSDTFNPFYYPLSLLCLLFELPPQQEPDIYSQLLYYLN
jgi:hypothetical protein